MAVTITVAIMKGAAYLDLDHANLDAAIQIYIDGVVNSAIDFLDDEDIISAATLPEALEVPLCKQINKEVRRRADPGLTSVSFPDGSINKISSDEWIPSVKKALIRHKDISI